MKMLTVEEAQALILAEIQPLEAESVLLEKLGGRIAAADVRCQWPLPGWDNSAMDGYAVRAADVSSVPSCLAISDHIAAGDGRPRVLAPGTAARIFTGALLPDGADTVIVQEDTVRDGDSVQVNCLPRFGQHIRRAGSDVSAGALICTSGRVLTPGDISLLASQGYTETMVYERPVVTILTTGNELRSPGSGRPDRGEIIDGNTVALANAARAAGGLPNMGNSSGGLPTGPKDSLI